MVAPYQTAASALRYRLAPDEAARAAIEATFTDYHLMMEVLDAIVSEKNIGSNLVALHAHAYDAIRQRTRLPSRLVTLGLRDRIDYRNAQVARLPLDEKLVNIKTATTLTLGTALGRVSIPFDVAGYAQGWNYNAPACLIQRDGAFEIHFGVTPNLPPEQENVMVPETILSRVGRLISGIAHVAIDKAEDSNKTAVVQQAIREIEEAEQTARADLAQARAGDYRLKARRSEIEKDLADLATKIRTAITETRDDLAEAGIARQLDLEAQLEVLSKALADNDEVIEANVTSLHAVRSALQDAEARLADLKKSEAAAATQAMPAALRQSADSITRTERASRAIARTTGVPAGGVASLQGIDELSALHRDKEIADRLAKLKSQT
ncbi:PspA/IM30 family protein [Bradyrhizobium prioriisuperbiae]|uniref:PspA/IM30 family protein n=1 Tax=Bradyrhizobium prioriisuperbiae TaxID=2854389 RepID=UPI0028E4DCC7|nr:PspA/IM30 family protein [Bradyrhizobium prioritasuperba]